MEIHKLVHQIQIKKNSVLMEIHKLVTQNCLRIESTQQVVFLYIFILLI